MKRNIIIILILSLFLSFEVKALNNPYSSKGPYGVNCTWYTWKKVNEKTGISLPAWGNAKTWYKSAEKAGYSVGKTSKKNSVVVWSITSYGHVGYVERVSGNDIYVWDSDSKCIDESDKDYIACMEASVSEETDNACKEKAKLTACKFDANEDVIGYIYLDDVPKTTTQQTTTSAPASTKTTTTTRVKSNDNYLTNLTISNGSISFDKEVFEYEVDVESDIESISIGATPSDKLATVSGTGDFALSVGENVFKVNVTSENGDIREYSLYVNRKEKQEEDIKIVKKKNNKVFILLGVLFGVFLLILFIILFKKIRK